MKVSLSLLDSPYTVGLAYEKLTLAVLKNYSFYLRRTGGSGDGGQDFIGHWVLSKKKIPIVGQCKCYSKPIGPRYVREFEDVLYRKFVKLDNPSLGSVTDTRYVGLLISQSWFSEKALQTFLSSQMAMIVMQIIETTTFSSTKLEPETGHTTAEPSDVETSVEPITTGHKTAESSGVETAETITLCEHDSNFNNEETKHNTQREKFSDLQDYQTSHLNHGQTLLVREVDIESDHNTVRCSKDHDRENKMVGYINEIAINRKAMRTLGNIQVTWKYKTGLDYLNRTLILRD